MKNPESQIISTQDIGSSLPTAIDQILDGETVEFLTHMNRVVGGNPGQEFWADMLNKPNWPPRKFERLMQLVNDIIFRIKNPHAWEAFQELIAENEKSKR